MIKSMKELWMQKNEKKILLVNDVNIELYKEFINTQNKNRRLTASLLFSEKNFSNYKFSFTAVPDWINTHKNNILVVPRRFDYFQTKMVNYKKYRHVFSYPGNFTLRTRNVSSLHHLYLKNNLVTLFAITDKEAQFAHNWAEQRFKLIKLDKQKSGYSRHKTFKFTSKVQRYKRFYTRKWNWGKINKKRYWNLFYDFTLFKNLKIFLQLLYFKFLRRKNRVFSLIEKKPIKNLKKKTKILKKKQPVLFKLKIKKFLLLRQKKNYFFQLFLKSIAFFNTLLFHKKKKLSTTFLCKRQVKKHQSHHWSFFILLVASGLKLISFRKKKPNFFLSQFGFAFLNKKNKLKFNHPLLTFYFKFLRFLFIFFKKKIKNVLICSRLLTRFLFLARTLNFTFFKKKKIIFFSKKNNAKYKKLSIIEILKFLGQQAKSSLISIKKIKKTRSMKKKKSILNFFKFNILRKTKPFLFILRNLRAILNQIAHLKRSAKFKRNIIHTMYKYTSLLEFHSMMKFSSPFRFFTKNMLRTWWLNESYRFFVKYTRRKGRPLLNSMVLIRPIFKKIKNLGMPFLRFFIKNPTLHTNKILPLNLHKVFLNSLKTYFIPLKSVNNTPFLKSVTKRLPFVCNSLQPIRIVFSPYKQRKRSLQVNILNFNNENLFSSWPGLAIRKISAIVGVHKAHKYTFLIHMKPKKAKRNFMAKALTIRHASNFLYKYFRKVGGPFEVTIRTTTGVSFLHEDSYVKLLMGFIYKGFKKKNRNFSLLKKQNKYKKSAIPYKYRKMRHSFSSQFIPKRKAFVSFAKKISSKPFSFVDRKKFLLRKLYKLKYVSGLKVFEKKPVRKILKITKFLRKKKKFGLPVKKNVRLVKIKSFRNKKFYSYKYLLIFFRYLVLIRKMFILLIKNLLVIKQQTFLKVLAFNFSVLVRYQAIFMFFIKVMFFKIFILRFLKKKKSKLKTKKPGRGLHLRPFSFLLKRLKYGYFRTVKKTYFTQYNVYNKTTHGLPTKKRKNRRL